MRQRRRSSTIRIVLALFGTALSSCHGLVPPKNPLRSVRTAAASSPPRKIMTMYFDDVSRHSIQWTPTSTSNTMKANVRRQQQHPSSSSSYPSFSEQKMDAIQRMLLGYDAESASLLSPDEVLKQVRVWATKSGCVGEYFNDELYREMVGTTCLNAASVVGALAQFWDAIANGIIREHVDEYPPYRWTAKTTTPSSPLNNKGGSMGDAVHFVIFPNCPDLYDYKTMFTFVMAAEFSKELCSYLGKRFSPTLFHPKYKNAPKMLSPERHSPFPVCGLEFHNPPQSVADPSAEPRAKPPKRQRGNLFKRGVQMPIDAENEDENLIPIVEGKLFDIDQQRDRLEVLLNSAAVSGSDNVNVGEFDEPPDDDNLTTSSGESSEELLSSTFRKEQRKRRRIIPAATVKAASKAWIENNRYTDIRRTNENRALRFIDTVPEDRWVVSDQKIAECVYAEIWQTISDLYEVGVEAEKDFALKKEKEEVEESIRDAIAEDDSGSSGSPNGRFSFMNFMKSLQQTTDDENRKRRRRDPVVVSSLFVTAKFCAYNAQKWRTFAISINAALKRLTGGKMYLMEVFHNEYMGKGGADNSLRRSPFPMILICFEVAPDSCGVVDSI